jgi:hypothetical protein
MLLGMHQVTKGGLKSVSVEKNNLTDIKTTGTLFGKKAN